MVLELLRLRPARDLVRRLRGKATDQFPRLTTIIDAQKQALASALALSTRQAAQIQTALKAVDRLQGINDLLDARARESERKARDAELRSTNELDPRDGIGTPRKFSVLFISASPNNPSHAYRVDNYVAALSRLGVEASWLPDNDLHGIIEKVRNVSIVVAWRVALTAEMQSVVLACRTAGVPIVFDVDDYVFEPRVATPEFVDGLRFLPAREIGLYAWGVTGYRRFLLEADAVTVTTKFLAERARQLGRPAYVLANGLDEAYEKAGSRVGCAPGARSLVRIGYTPGSRTHQKDFKQCSAAIARILQEHPRARLTIVGNLDLDEFPEFNALRDQIEEDPTIGRAHVRARTPDFDIHIAPVEIANPFTEAKSELKFFEPAVSGVPTVASGTRPFLDAIENGVDGFTVATGEEWYKALSALVSDDELRREVGCKAREKALSRYGLTQLGIIAHDAYAEIIRVARRGHGILDDRLCISVLVNVAANLEMEAPRTVDLLLGLRDLGHLVRVHVVDSPPPEVLLDLRPPIPGLPTIWGALPTRPCDVVIATSSATALELKSLERSALVRCYLLPSDGPEPLLFQDDQHQEHLKDVLVFGFGSQRSKHGDVPVEYLPLAIDGGIFKPADQFRTRRKIAVFESLGDARGHELTRAVLQVLEESRSEFEIVRFSPALVDSLELTSSELPPGARARLFRGSSAGLILSSRTQRSLCLEMTRCGLPVLTSGPETPSSDSGMTFVQLDPVPDVVGIAQRLLAVARDEELRERVWLTETSRRYPTGFEVADRFESSLHTALSASVNNGISCMPKASIP